MSKYGENFWKSLLLEWSQNSSTIQSFCKGKGISPSCFNLWRKKFPELGTKIHSSSKIKKDGFIELHPQDTEVLNEMKPIEPSARYLIIRSSHGYTIEVPL